jgi:hypothetical protein
MSIGLAAVRKAGSGLVRLYLCNFPLLARLLGMPQLSDPSRSPPARPVRPIVSVASTA